MGVRNLTEIVLAIISRIELHLQSSNVISIWRFLRLSLGEHEVCIIFVCIRGKNKPIFDKREGKRLGSIGKKLLSRLADFGR